MFNPQIPEQHVAIAQHDPESLLGTTIRLSFELEGQIWPSIEHYIQAHRLGEKHHQALLQFENPLDARAYGKRWYRRPLKAWLKTRRIHMTRAVYTRAMTHKTVAKALLDTGEELLVNLTQYDYYWGTGRDHRGENVYGKVLMDVRQKLREQQAQNQSAE